MFFSFVFIFALVKLFFYIKYSFKTMTSSFIEMKKKIKNNYN